MFWAFAQEIKLFEDKNYIFSRFSLEGNTSSQLTFLIFS